MEKKSLTESELLGLQNTEGHCLFIVNDILIVKQSAHNHELFDREGILIATCDEYLLLDNYVAIKQNKKCRVYNLQDKTQSLWKSDVESLKKQDNSFVSNKIIAISKNNWEATFNIEKMEFNPWEPPKNLKQFYQNK